MKRKIIFIIESLNCGGAEKSLVSLLPLLDKDKFEIHLMLMTRGGDFENYVPDYVIFDSYNKETGFNKLIARLLYSIAIRINRKKRNFHEIFWDCKSWAIPKVKEYFDVAIAYGQGFPTYYTAEKINAKKKYAWINADLAKMGFDSNYNKNFYKKFNKIIPVSDILAQKIVMDGFTEPEKSLTVYDIVNPSLIKELSKNSPDTTILNKTNQLKFCTTGRLHKAKGYDLAVETAKLLKDENIDFIWYFVGEGKERRNIESLIRKYQLENTVFLLGMKSNPYPYIKAADIYIQTSKAEGFCITVAEAKILGKPIVSTNFPVIYDQIKDGENGLIAKMDAQSLKEKIMKLILDSGLKNEIIKNLASENNNTMLTEANKVNKLLMSN